MFGVMVKRGAVAAFARRDEGSFCRRGWGGHAAASLPHSGARNCGHCWTVFRVPEFAVGVRGCWAWAFSSLRACELAFCLLLQSCLLRRAYGASRSFQLRRIMSPIHSASRESDQQWPFSREAECGRGVEWDVRCGVQISAVAQEAWKRRTTLRSWAAWASSKVPEASDVESRSPTPVAVT